MNLYNCSKNFISNRNSSLVKGKKVQIKLKSFYSDKLNMSLKRILLSLMVLFIVSNLIIKPTVADDFIEGTVKGSVCPGCPGPTPGQTQCGNNVTSCGRDNLCIDLTGMVYCVKGRIVETKCSYNKPINDSSLTRCQLFQPQLNVKNKAGSQRSINITLYSPGTTDEINSFSINGLGSIYSLSSMVDFELYFDDSNLNFKARNLNLSKLSSSIDLIIDKLSITTPNADVYKAFLVELPSNFTYSSITLNIKYSGITIRNENNLKLYRCDSFNSTANTCNGNWTAIDTTLDSNNDVASANINHFSVYALGEPKQQTTTTTPTTTTTTVSSSDDEDNSDSYSSYHSSSSSTPTTTTLPECIEHKPYLSVTPISQAGAVGDTLQYSVSVKNMDSIECESREFEFDFKLPEGWDIDYDQVGEIRSGDTKIIDVMITSSNETVTNETYQLSVYVLDKISGEQSNTVYFKYIVNALPSTEPVAKTNQFQSSPITAFTSLVTQNQLVLMLPAVVSIIAYIIWKRPVLMIKGLPKSYGQRSYNGVSPSKIVVKLESDAQPKINTFNNGKTFNGEINTTFNNGNNFNGGNGGISQKQINYKPKTSMIEEIRRKALKEDELLRKRFNY